MTIKVGGEGELAIHDLEERRRTLSLNRRLTREQLKHHVVGKVECAVNEYEYNWGNRICEGILPLCILRPHNASDVSMAIQLARQERLPGARRNPASVV